MCSFFYTNKIVYNMKKTYKGQSMFCEIKYTLADCFKNNKIKFLIAGLVLLLSLVLGIFIGIRHYKTSYYTLSDYGLVNFTGGVLSSSFFTRFFSMLLIVILLFACCFTPFTYPLAILILAYRTYLLGLNLTLLFILYGIPGMLISAIIALPCQFIIMLLLLICYILLYNNACCCKQFGSSKGSGKLKILIIILVALLICNLLETILLAIFNAKVILVI